MNWKLTVIGLGFVIALLVAASVFGISTDASIPGPIKIYYPTASLSGILMYGWVYSTSTAPYQYAPVIAQSINSISAPQGQTISKSVIVSLPNPLMPNCPTSTVNITASLTMNSASLSNIFLYAVNITTTSGSLNNVVLVSSGLPYVVNQTISSATMNGLTVYAYYVSVGSLSYSGLSVTVTPALITCSSSGVTTSNVVSGS
ncbi:hypothetical protein [Vulcanisaeta distributa]|uniref:Uncharacterized protein n=1 Tax=Vulcanisaeta distributa (strain DSM 14429 / JCM 11212 / NBRC 100878 / IC-017) TaxID=572478 RepID=E1QT84_VULDI|nr:hypothetical protein [Vulcanisaeta distributa]ADN49676.1 hypothetical protein Vdis_0267 [Vulcanisaeta distributa DSM 14429]